MRDHAIYGPHFLTVKLKDDMWRLAIRIRPESVVNEVAGYHLVEKALPVAVPPRGGKALDLSSHLGPVLHHLALDVKLERFLPEVGIHDLARSLERNFNELWS